MTTDSRRPRIAWLLNLYSDPAQQHAHGAELLRTLTRQLGADVIPFYCIDYRSAALQSIAPEARVEFTRARLAALLAEHDLPVADAVLVSAGEDPDTDDKADALVSAMAARDVLFTFVHSQTHSAVDRFLVGSLSEAILARARRPVLLLNPHASVPDAFDSIVIGTDLSDACADAFDTLLPIARLLGARVHIEHQIVVRELSPFMSSDATRAQYGSEIAEMRAQATGGMQRLLTAAQKAGVPTTTGVEVEGPSITPGEGLEGRARNRRTAIIAVPARGGRTSRGKVGNTALWLIRHAHRPVLVIPAKG